MKNGILKALKVLGILLALLGVLSLLVYTQLWNPHVSVSVQSKGQFPLTAEQKLDDFEYLYQTLKDSFPYFEVKKRQFGFDWLGRKEEFTDRIKATQSDKEYYTALSEIVMLIQNGHTHIIAPGAEFENFEQIYSGPQPWAQVLGHPEVKRCYEYWESIIPENDPEAVPISFRYVEGNYYASRNLINPEKSTDELGIPMGSKLLEVEGVAVDSYIKDLVTQRLLRYDPIREKFKLNLFSIKSEDGTELTYALPDGRTEKKVLKPFKPDALEEASRSLPEHLFSTEIIDEGRVAYLRLPSLSSSFVDKDRDGIRAFLEEIRQYSSLIIDIRGNGGGSTNYWMGNIVPLLTDKPLKTRNYLLLRDSGYLKPFIKNKMFHEYFFLRPVQELGFFKDKPGFYFSDNQGAYKSFEYVVWPSKPVGFSGKILLLVDDSVYSSAEAFAAFAKDTGWATLVGTRTGGDGIGFDPVFAALPNSGLVVRFPAEMGLNPDGSINEEMATMPDVYIEPSYRDFIEKIKKESESGRKLSFKENLQYDTILKKAVELAFEN